MNIHITAWIIPLIPVTMSIGFGLIPTATIKSRSIHIQYGLFLSCIHIPSFSYCCFTFKCLIAIGFSANFSIQQIHRKKLHLSISRVMYHWDLSLEFKMLHYGQSILITTVGIMVLITLICLMIKDIRSYLLIFILESILCLGRQFLFDTFMGN